MSKRDLKASVIIGGAMSSTFRAAMSDTKSGMKQIGEAIANAERKQRLLSSAIEQFGKQRRNVSGMREEYGRLTAQVDRLKRAQSGLATANARLEANRALRQEYGGKVRQSAATVGAIGAAVFMPIRQAVEFETAMLGIAKQVDGARDKSGKLTDAYYQMRREIQQMGRELPLATNSIADMVTAGARMGVAREHLAKFARMNAMMATAFELPADEIAENMGKIAGIFRIPIPAIGELGDAINALDDSSQATGRDIIKVMQGDLAGAASTMGMSAKNAAALASTFLTLGESAERADTAASGMLRQLQIAKMNPKRFQIGVEMIGMTGDQLQKGMITDTQGTILDVLKRIKALKPEQQMEAVTRLFGKDWGGAIAKLANNVDEYRRQIELANGEAAKGSMSREFQSRMQTTAAQWQITKNRVTEVAVALGDALLPAVNSIMAGVAPMASKFAAFAKAHPGAIKGIVGTAFALSGMRLALAAAGYAWTAFMGPVLKARQLIAKFRVAKELGTLGRFGPVLTRVASAARIVGAAIGAIGGGPIALAVAALTVGALVVRKYWQPIKAFMAGVFKGVSPAIRGIGAALAPLKPAWDAVAGAIGAAWAWVMKLIKPVQWTTDELGKAESAGVKVGQVLATSFTVVAGVVGTVVDTVFRLARGIGWLTEKAGGLVGVAGNAMKVIPGAGVIGTAASTIGGMVLGSPAPGRQHATNPPGAPPRAPAPKLRAVPAVTIAAPQSNTRTANVQRTEQHSHTYHITQQPGESAEALARRVASINDRKAAVRGRGRLVDGVAA